MNIKHLWKSQGRTEISMAIINMAEIQIYFLIENLTLSVGGQYDYVRDPCAALGFPLGFMQLQESRRENRGQTAEGKVCFEVVQKVDQLPPPQNPKIL